MSIPTRSRRLRAAEELATAVPARDCNLPYEQNDRERNDAADQPSKDPSFQLGHRRVCGCVTEARAWIGVARGRNRRVMGYAGDCEQ